MSGVGIALAERGLLPLAVLRYGVRQLLEARLREIDAGPPSPDFLAMLEASPLAVATDSANEQHYEVPAAFFEQTLGPKLKYSGAYWPEGVSDLAAAEEAMLELTSRRAELEDGQEILELGCGWGSLTLHMARRFPNARITAVSNSASQRRHIESRAPANVRVVTADMRDFEPTGRFDRVVSVEMFEHMRNLPELMRRISTWLVPDGKLFVHVFCHRTHSYLFETEAADDWMGRYFFTGGMMPAYDLLADIEGPLMLDDRWIIDGSHYGKTAQAWRENLEARRAEVMPVLESCYGREAERWYHRWRLFFLACEELFGYRGGREWWVGHYRFVRRS
ncbi:MAG: cyclopropane-fatty-acyl-phospholipid synthase family protein [Gemmatimonadota bacterium]